MYCRFCGKKLREDVRYCGRCGAKIERVEEKEQQFQTVRIEYVVAQMQKRREGSFEEFYHLTKKYVRYVVGGYFPTDRARAEDVIQEVYITVFEKIHTLKDPSCIWSWMNTIIKNKTINIWEKERKYILMDEEVEKFLDNAQSNGMQVLPEEILEQIETTMLLGKIIEELPYEQQLVLREYYYLNKKVSEIALEYDMPEGTVKSYLARGRKNLGEKIKEYFE